MNDRERVLALLELRDSWLPGPKTWTGSVVSSSSKPGETPSKRIECPSCVGIGKRGRDRCERCKGKGRIVVDDYTGRTADAPPETAALAVEVRRERQQKRDSEIRRLQRMELVRSGMEAVADANTIAIEAKARLYRLGDFGALDRALARLEREFPRLLGAVLLVYDRTAKGVQVEMRARMQAEADAGLDLIIKWMGPHIRVPLDWTPPAQMLAKGRWANPAARQKRDKEVFRLWSEGIGYREIGRRVGLSHVHVMEILRGVKAA